MRQSLLMIMHYFSLAVTSDLMYYRINKQLALDSFIAEICINLLFFFYLTRQKGVSVFYKQIIKVTRITSRCVSDCRSRGREFDPGPVPYFRGD